MLASRWPAPFVDDDWSFEIKWDGIRGILTAGPDVDLRIMSRAGNQLTARYPELNGFSPDRAVVLDGEIIALDSRGVPSFEVLQQRMGRTGRDAAGIVPVSFVVFDILFDGTEVIHEPWTTRRTRIEALELEAPFQLSTVVAADPTALWALVQERGIEGIVAKRTDGIYRPGERSSDWRKITRFRQVRAVVGGFLPGEGGRSGTFGSLLLGLWTEDGLRWIGSVGSGFTDRQLRAIRMALDEMRLDQSPFADVADIPRGAVWVAPHLVALVQYKEFTRAGRLRGPSFKGFTDDDAMSPTWESEGPDSPS